MATARGHLDLPLHPRLWSYLSIIVMVFALMGHAPAAHAHNACLAKACGIVGCTNYGYFPTADEACPSGLLATFQVSGPGFSDYVCGKIVRGQTNASFADCSTNVCKVGQTFSQVLGHCVSAKKPQCQAKKGDPIDISNGNNYQEDIDAQGGGLTLTRDYLYSLGSNPEKPGQGSWRFAYRYHIKLTGYDGVSDSKAVYTLTTDQNVEYIFEGNANDGYAFRVWQQPPFESVTKIPDTAPQPGWLIVSKQGTQYRFDKAGDLTSIVNLKGTSNSFTSTLNATGQAVSTMITNSRSGAQLTYTLDPASGHVTKATLNNAGTSLTYQYGYDSKTGLLSSMTRPDGATVTYHYDDSRFPQALTSVTDAKGNTYSQWTYDADGHAVSSAHAGGVDKTTLAFNSDGSTTVTNPLGKQTIYHFAMVNGARKIVSVTGVASPSCQGANKAYTYYSNGLLKTKTDWKGNVTAYTYNDRGLQTGRIEAEGTPQERTITTEWDSRFALPIKITKPDQVITMTYDAKGRLLTRTVSPN